MLRAHRHLDCASLNSVTLTDREQFHYSEGEFDTVVDTFGLCSCADPVAALKEMKKVRGQPLRSGSVLLCAKARARFANLFTHALPVRH